VFVAVAALVPRMFTIISMVIAVIETVARLARAGEENADQGQ
jgi:hypothetical protein